MEGDLGRAGGERASAERARVVVDLGRVVGVMVRARGEGEKVVETAVEAKVEWKEKEATDN